MTPQEIVYDANDWCEQENLIQQQKGGVYALTAPLDNLESNWTYMVTASLAWSLKKLRQESEGPGRNPESCLSFLSFLVLSLLSLTLNLHACV